MKRLKAYLIIVVVLASLFASGQATSDPLQTVISISTDSLTKSQLLDTLESVANVYFSYSPSLLTADQKIAVNFDNQTLASILQRLANPGKVGFKSIGNQIIFFPLASVPVAEEKPQYKLVRGVITEGRKDDPVPYCNIAIQGYFIGTISNKDGRFSLKISPEHYNDTIRFSCVGYNVRLQPINQVDTSELQVRLLPNTVQLRAIEVVHYNPQTVIDSFAAHLKKNYETDHALFTTFYREVIKQNDKYTDISEAVLEVMKAPYDSEFHEDNVKFIKGRRSSNVSPYDKIKLKLKGGPYYITKLDVVKNFSSFIDPESFSLYKYTFEKITLLDEREAIVISFEPLYLMRDMLYKGKLFIDRDTWALARIEFSLTKEGLAESRSQLIEKEPKKLKAIPTNLDYTVCYKKIGAKWYLNSVKSHFEIKVIDRKNRQRTRFNSCNEMITTEIEKGNFQQFSHRDIFKPNEFISEKISGNQLGFWEEYNVIEPEEELSKAIRNFDVFNLQVKQTETKK